VTEHQMDDDQRRRLEDELIGPPTTAPGTHPREPWAPAWWHGDEDATASSMAAMRALGGARR